MHKFMAAALLLAGLHPLVTSAAAETVAVSVAGAAKAALPAIPCDPERTGYLGPRRKGAIARDTIVDLGRTGVGLAGRPGLAAAAVETPDQLRALLLGASLIGYADPARGATAGTLFAKALMELGLAAPLKERLRVFPFGVDVIAAVEQGRIEVGVSQATEILSRPVQFLGYLPEPYQSWTPY